MVLLISNFIFFNIGLVCFTFALTVSFLATSSINKSYSKVLKFLKSCSEDGSTKIDDFMRGEYLPFAEKTAVKKDCIFECLMAESESNLDVATRLPPLFKSMLGVANNMTRICCQVVNIIILLLRRI